MKWAKVDGNLDIPCVLKDEKFIYDWLLSQLQLGNGTQDIESFTNDELLQFAQNPFVAKHWAHFEKHLSVEIVNKIKHKINNK